MSRYIPILCVIAMYFIGVINGLLIGYERGYNDGYHVVAEIVEAEDE